ncbi:hypothetical protein H9I45_02600 [Polaribacter haliotis]|uniref:Uncharacterized protein n=1 Tax=Polaribacter haliotis TaxID=1888915 RepID=A0A7L8AH79_9FLAO|nr:hypothetical protein [Polaribacter haliotis]QOD61356.1 hypothetical protein H9I45_02600 [Polaribacter haliotis]
MLNKELPFDVRFYLKVKIPKTDEIERILYINTVGKERLFPEPGINKLSKIDYFLEPIDDKFKFLVLRMPALAPNKLYDISIRKKFSGKILEELIQLNYLFKEKKENYKNTDNNNNNNNNNKENSFSDCLKELKKKTENYDISSAFFHTNDSLYYKKDSIFNLLIAAENVMKKDSFTTFEKRFGEKKAKNLDSTIFNTKIKQYYKYLYKHISKTLKEKKETIKNNEKNCDTLILEKIKSDSYTINIIKQYYKIISLKCDSASLRKCTGVLPYNLSTYNSIYDTILKNKFESLDSIAKQSLASIKDIQLEKKFTEIANFFKATDDKSFKTSLKLLANLKSLESNILNQFLNGRGSIIDKKITELTSLSNFTERIKNIDKNITILNTYVEDLKYISLLNSSYNSIYQNDSKRIYELVQFSNATQKLLKKIVSIITSYDNNITETFLLPNTLLSTVSSESKKLVIPDFGVLYFFDGNKPGLRPFLGANINIFGPVNKDLRSKYMDDYTPPGSNIIGRYLRNHFSLMIGLSLGTIAEDNRRKDLFTNFNLITGISYRVNRSVRLSYGRLWYNKIDPNPIISESKFSSLGYFSASFDIEFKKASGSTFNKIF